MAGEQLVGPIPDGWEYTTLGAACERGGGDIQTGPFGSQLHASDYVPVGVPSIMPLNIGDNRIVENGIARITQADAQRLSRYLVRKGDIVYSRRGDVERRALVREREDGWLCGTGCLRVRLGKKGVDPRYAAFYLGHPSVREWVVRHAHGATMPNLNTSILAACPFVVPPLPEQHAIAYILGTLDDKIELNWRMNETQEAMTRALFKSWFVDFDPVCAKAEGRPSYLTPELWSLFPTALDDDDKPVGWENGILEDVAEIIMGASPDGSTYNTDGIGVPLVNGPVEYGDFFLRRIKWTTLPGKLSKYGDLILCVRGSTTGRHAFADGEYCLGRGVAAIRAKDDQQEFVDHVVRRYLEELLQHTTGSVFPNLSSADIRGLRIVVPNTVVRRAFSEFVRPLRKQEWANVQEAKTLAALRDTLLPKLISGALRVRDAERFIGRAV